MKVTKGTKRAKHVHAQIFFSFDLSPAHPGGFWWLNEANCLHLTHLKFILLAFGPALRVALPQSESIPAVLCTIHYCMYLAPNWTISQWMPLVLVQKNQCFRECFYLTKMGSTASESFTLHMPQYLLSVNFWNSKYATRALVAANFKWAKFCSILNNLLLHLKMHSFVLDRTRKQFPNEKYFCSV